MDVICIWLMKCLLEQLLMDPVGIASSGPFSLVSLRDSRRSRGRLIFADGYAGVPHGCSKDDCSKVAYAVVMADAVVMTTMMWMNSSSEGVEERCSDIN
ncbi:hypothetical protein GW17_00018497 [Ensete ventricosum]|nr:hypothetical protein GW17_00018497 [Ensete ventricosum]